MDYVGHIHNNEGRVRDLESGRGGEPKGAKVEDKARGHDRSGHQDETRMTAEVGGPDRRPAGAGGATIGWVAQRCSCHGIVHDRSQSLREEQFDARGAQGVMDFIRSDQYKYLYWRQEVASGAVPPKRNKDRKLSRKTMNQSQCA
ncbi:hypothetical protein KIN20_021798 [Parelaphostrongylus tenuis]|uniref:Uncharacterized protein n=1 Tax=Parelaphostrongylus tenuis TaxID=148309 RepID=A0AAD5N512_PARTN|nr:hypothetical protein KIN20_021798 [Parelaphostrongylus tenuis]